MTCAFCSQPEGHTGGALNMVPAFVGYLLANALTGTTRGWLMGQGHCVAAIEAVNESQHFILGPAVEKLEAEEGVDHGLVVEHEHGAVLDVAAAQFGKLAAHIVHVRGTGAAGQGGDGGKAIQGGGLEGHGGESRSSGIKAEV